MSEIPQPEDIYRLTKEEGVRRLERPLLEVISTALAAGFDIVAGIVALALVSTQVEPWVGQSAAHVFGSLAFGIGFVFLVVGRGELFTENFLVPIAGLDHRRGSSWLALAKLWLTSPLFNVLGGTVMILLLSTHDVLPSGTGRTLAQNGDTIHAHGPLGLFVSAIFAGALITAMTWFVEGQVSMLVRIVVAWIAGALLALGQLQPRDRDHARADLRLPARLPLRVDVHPRELLPRGRGQHARRRRPRHAQPPHAGQAGRAEARLCLNRPMEQLRVGDESYGLHKLPETAARLPYTLRILLENVLRQGSEDGADAVASWVADAEPSREISFAPARVLLQDFTGVPCVVDLAAMRDAMRDQGGDPKAINPLIPVELVIDHSVQVDEFASRLAIERNVELEFERNHERYAFLRWGQGAFDNFRVVPPNTGIVHQVNLEYLARVVEVRDGVAFPDTLVGTDSHTTMVNGLGVLGWGVGGIEAEAAMLGEALSMLVPQVVGFRLTGALREGATATDLVLTVTQILRKTGVVGKFVEYFGPGVGSLALADRATLGNMSPEYGATCGFFPVDEVTVEYLRLTGRSAERIALVEAYCKENLLWHEPEEHPEYSQVVELDLDDVEPSLAGPRRPQDRVPLANAKDAFIDSLDTFGVAYTNGSYDKEVADSFPASDPPTGDGVPTPPSTHRCTRRRSRRSGSRSRARTTRSSTAPS